MGFVVVVVIVIVVKTIDFTCLLLSEHGLAFPNFVSIESQEQCHNYDHNNDNDHDNYEAPQILVSENRSHPNGAISLPAGSC